MRKLTERRRVRREVDPFEVLGVPQDADIPAVRKAFHKLARKWHPDKNAGEKEEEAKRMMQKLNEAYDACLDRLGQGGSSDEEE